MHHPMPRLTMLITCAALLCTSAWAQSDDGTSRRKRSYARSNKIQVDRGSAETTRERERRLTRECKGRSNSGACEGYTR
jgi:hypothetical protein